MWNKGNPHFIQATLRKSSLVSARHQLAHVKIINSYTHQALTITMYDKYQLQKSTCVNTCPAGYSSTDERLCLPINDEKRAAYLSNPSVSSPFDYQNFKDTLLWSSLFTLGVGLFWLVLSFCFPRLAPIIAHILGALTLITLGILTLVLWDR